MASPVPSCGQQTWPTPSYAAEQGRVDALEDYTGQALERGFLKDGLDKLKPNSPLQDLWKMRKYCQQNLDNYPGLFPMITQEIDSVLCIRITNIKNKGLDCMQKGNSVLASLHSMLEPAKQALNLSEPVPMSDLWLMLWIGESHDCSSLKDQAFSRLQQNLLPEQKVEELKNWLQMSNDQDLNDYVQKTQKTQNPSNVYCSELLAVLTQSNPTKDIDLEDVFYVLERAEKGTIKPGVIPSSYLSQFGSTFDRFCARFENNS